MTQEELDRLPEMGGFGQEQRVIDGKTVWVPIAMPTFVLFVKDEDEAMSVVDSYGQRWMLGCHDGVRYKSRSMS